MSQNPPIKDRSLASLDQRFGAALVDGLVLLPFTYLYPKMKEGAYSTAVATLIVIAFVGIYGLQMILLSTSGQTVGKKVAKIRIVDFASGQNKGFVTNVLVRYLLNWLLCFIPLYGLIDVLFIFRGEQRRCVHDLIAKTKVIKAETIDGIA